MLCPWPSLFTGRTIGVPASHAMTPLYRRQRCVSPIGFTRTVMEGRAVSRGESLRGVQRLVGPSVGEPRYH